VEGAHQVLPSRQVDPDFSTNRAIHLREQRRRNLNKTEAAQICGCGEAGCITDDAAAESDDDRGPVDAALKQAIVQARYRRQLFGLFAVGDEQRRVSAEHVLHAGTVLPPHWWTTHHCGGADEALLGQHRAHLARERGPDEYGIRTTRVCDVQPNDSHRSSCRITGAKRCTCQSRKKMRL